MLELSYAEMLRRTEPEARTAPAPGSPEEARALDHFRSFFSDMTPERVRKEGALVYAENAILHDTLVTHVGLDAIIPYFVKTAERSAGVEVSVDQVIREGFDYYVRWTMDIRWSAFRCKGQTTRSVGMSHLRFGTDGKVILHHDFWDSASGFFAYLPFIGSLLRWIKKRVAG